MGDIFGVGKSLIQLPFDPTDDMEMKRAVHSVRRKLEQENLKLKGIWPLKVQG